MQENVITPNSIICQSQSQVSTEIDGEVVLLSIEKGNYYGMNKVLAAIWNWIERPMKVSDLCKKLTATYKVSEEVSEKDVMKVLCDLQKEGLIEIHHP